MTAAGPPMALAVGSLVLLLALIGACVRLAGEELLARRWTRSGAAFAAAGALFWLGVLWLQSRSGFPA